MKIIIVHVNHDDQNWFFSTDHGQETGEKYTPITLYNDTPQTARDHISDVWGKEIPNPDSRYMTEYGVKE